MKRLQRTYEGPEILADLLESSGCELTVEEVVEEFVCAVEEGTQAAEIVPLLWELEPRFPDAATARRTFSNLFGLWDDVAKGQTGDLVLLRDLDPDAPLTPAFVERAWSKLDALPDAEVTRLRDTFDNVQADVGAFVFEQAAGLGDLAAATALDLAFEMWWLCLEARGAVQRVTRASLTAAHAEPDDPESEPEPALAGLVTTTLWEQAADDEAPLPEDAIPRLERVLRALRHALAPAGAYGYHPPDA